MKRWQTLFERSSLSLSLLFIWQVLGGLGLLPRYVSTPWHILNALAEASGDGELWQAMAVSVMRVASGFGIGAGAGMIVGMAGGLVPPIRYFFDPLVSFLFAVPKIAFLPVFLLLLGIGDSSKIAIIAFSCFFPVFVASGHALVAVERLLVWAGRNMGAKPMTLFFRVMIPAAAPQLFTGLRIGLAHAFVVLFAAESIGSHAGLGTLVKDGEEAGRFDLMLGAILCFGVIGFLADRLLILVRARALRGQTIGLSEFVSR